MGVMHETLYTAKYVNFLNGVGQRLVGSKPLESALMQIAELIADFVSCTSCSIYVLEDCQFTLRAFKSSHGRSKAAARIAIQMGSSSFPTERVDLVSIPCQASREPRPQLFYDADGHSFEAFLSVPITCRERVIGLINLQHQQPHHHTKEEIVLISTIAALLGSEIELDRLETHNAELQRRLETRAVMERAKGILGRQLQVDEQTAYHILQKGSRQKRKPIREIAEAIILSEELRAVHPRP